MTINNYSDSSWTYKTSYIQPSTTKYYYFYGSAGTKYYIQMCDSQDGSSQLTEWGYSLKIDTKVSCYLAGSSTKLIENDDAAWTSKPYFTAVSTGYYVVAVTSWSSTITSAGYFGVGVIKQ